MTTPHDLEPPIREFQDRGVIWLLESRENLRALLQLVASDIAARLDFSAAERVNRSMVPPDLHKQEADVLYRVPYREASEHVLVYVLVEHQSRIDTWMPLRLLRYMVALWEAQCRAWDDEKAPQDQRRLTTVVPLVFYTGKTRWQHEKGLSALFDTPVALSGFIPRHDVLHLALDATPSEALTGSALAWVLRVLQVESAPLEDLERVVTQVVGALEELPEEQQAEWRRAMWFLCLLIRHRRGADEQEPLLNLVVEAAHHHRKEVTDMTMTGAEALIAKGRKEGREEGQIDLFIAVLEGRFGSLPDALIAKVRAHSKKGLEQLARQAGTAASLAEFEQLL